MTITFDISVINLQILDLKLLGSFSAIRGKGLLFEEFLLKTETEVYIKQLSEVKHESTVEQIYKQ